MDHNEILKKTNQYLTTIELIRGAYHDHFLGSVKLAELDFSEFLTDCVAYRAIVLTPGVDDSKYLKSQFDESLVSDPYRSWSKTLEGVKRYCAQFSQRHYVIILKGQVCGFDLSEYAKTLKEEIEAFCKVYENELTESKKLEELTYQAARLKFTMSRFKDEDELIAVSVKDWEIIDSFGT